MGITQDKNGLPIDIGTVVEVDETIVKPTRIGSVLEVVFREDGTVLKLAGVARSLVPIDHVERTDFSEFETLLFNALASNRVYLTAEKTRDLANNLIAAIPSEDNTNEDTSGED